MLRSWQNHQSLSPARRHRGLMMKQRPPPFSLTFALCCFCALRFTSGFPQSASPESLGDPAIPKSEISSKVMDLWNAIFKSMQNDEENNEDIYKRFLFHYSRAQEPTYPLKTGIYSWDLQRSQSESPPVHPLMLLDSTLSERRMKRFLDPASQIAAAEFTKKDTAGTKGRPFFLFRPRNGRTIEADEFHGT
ncbi:neuromedin-S isoform X2 [Emydura macquarii macquarii]|uniref:neuromedin-S isoform X2 n=1 Tax=Emydura macquarii macquarii TaxID=1129001 RepID=UPI00352BB3A7